MDDPVSSQPQRVLKIDDHDGVRSVARELFERRGFEVAAEADTGMSGLRAAEQLTPDAVVLDICLPDSNGVEVCRALTRANPGLAVLLASSDELAARRVEAVECGAVAVVPKMRLASLDLGGLLRRAQDDAGPIREEAGQHGRVVHRGTVASARVPWPGEESTTRRPPTASMRSDMLRSPPDDGGAAANPAPSSRTSSVRRSSSRTVIHTAVAPLACFCTFCTASMQT